MKVLLLVMAVGKSDYFHLTIPRLAALSQYVGCDFQVVTIGGDQYDPKHCWLKMQAADRQGIFYDRVVALDADILPNFEAMKECDACIQELFFNENLTLCIDQGTKAVTPRIKEYYDSLARHAYNPDLPKIGEPYYNAGVMGAASGRWSGLATRARALKNHEHGAREDQDFLNWYIRDSKIPVSILHPSCNWMAPQFRKESLECPLIHFAGNGKSFIREYASILAPTP
jgi:lipopolysaccharide biosynthesis glycosyltransferase